MFQPGKELHKTMLDSQILSMTANKFRSLYRDLRQDKIHAQYNNVLNQFLNSHCPRGVWLRRGAGQDGSGRSV